MTVKNKRQPVAHRTKLWTAFLMAAFTMLLYGNTLRNGYSFDDAYVTENNPRVQEGLAGIPGIFTSRYEDEEGNSFGYRPIAPMTFALENTLWGQNPHAGHFINLLLYAIILFMLFRLLGKIFKSAHPLFLLAIVLLFAAHPIHTEAVASLKNREALLSFLFGMGSLLCFLKFHDTKKYIYLAGSILSFIIAFLSKQDVINFAALLPLALYYRSEKTADSRGWKANSGFWHTWNLPLALISLFLSWLLITHGQLVAGTALYFLALTLLILIYFKERPVGDKVRFTRLHDYFLLAGALVIVAAGLLRSLNTGIAGLLLLSVFLLKYHKFVRFSALKRHKTLIIILLSVLTLALAGILAYLLPGTWLPPEDKVLYGFENPSFTGDPDYPVVPLGFYTLFFYLEKLIWPHPLGFYYGYRMIPPVGWHTPEVILSLILHAAILIFALWKLPKKHILSFAILWYLITISVFSNFVIQIPGIVGERLAFFPSLGFCIALAWGIFRILGIDIRAAKFTKAKAMPFTLLLLLFLLPYSIKTISRNAQWKSHMSLFEHDIDYLGNSAKANELYANELLKEAFSNEKGNPPPEVQMKYVEQARDHLKKTVGIDSTYKFAWNNLGYITYQYLGEKDEGKRYIKKAVKLDPAYDKAQFNLGYIYKIENQNKEALGHFTLALSRRPLQPNYLLETADAHLREGDTLQSLSLYERLAKVTPGSDVAYINMGNIYWNRHDTLDAVRQWENAFRVNPGNPDVCSVLARYYKSKSDPKGDYYGRIAGELQK